MQDIIESKKVNELIFNHILSKYKNELKYIDKKFELLNYKKLSNLIESIDKKLDDNFVNAILEPTYYDLYLYFEHLGLNLNRLMNINKRSVEYKKKVFKLLADLQFSFWVSSDHEKPNFDSMSLLHMFELTEKKFIDIHSNKNSKFKKLINFFYKKNKHDPFINFAEELKRNLSNERYYFIPKLQNRYLIIDLHMQGLDTFNQDLFLKKFYLYHFYKFINITMREESIDSFEKICNVEHSQFFEAVQENLDLFTITLPKNKYKVIKHNLTYQSTEFSIYTQVFELFESLKPFIPIDYHIPRALYYLGLFDNFSSIIDLFENHNNEIFNERDQEIYKLRKATKIILNILYLKLFFKDIYYQRINLTFSRIFGYHFPLAKELVKSNNLYMVLVNCQNFDYSRELLNRFNIYNSILIDNFLFGISKFKNKNTVFKIKDDVPYIKVDTINF